MGDTVNITIDGRPVEVPAGQLVIEAAIQHGTYVPHFCWHPRMNPVGMCRMCLVELETPRGTIMTTSCTTRVTEGMVVNTATPTVKKAHEGILEFLLINHPLDCPVCDRGGECPLQDQTMGYGPGESRFVEEKRHFEKPIPISDLVYLDRERCILCARCTRFSEEISGDPLIEFGDRGYGTQVQTFPDEPFSSYFSGNTVQICPVGALTAVPYRFRARPWDLAAVESSCPHCTVGCRISVQSSQNQVLRFLGVDNEPTNQGWLSDKCRFGFEFIGSEERLRSPLVRDEGGELREASWGEALDLVAARLGAVIDEHGSHAVAGLGGARGTNEDAYAFGKFLRTVVGTNHLDAQLDDGLAPEFLAAITPRAQISDLERARSILLWGPDLKEEVGTLYLRVRRAAQELGATLIVVHPRRTGLDDRAAFKFSYRPGEGPEVLRLLAAGEGEFAGARRALDQGPVVAIVGRTGYAEDRRLAEAVAAFARDLPDATIMPVARRANVFGALDMGLAPTLLPGRVSVDGRHGRAALEEGWGEVPSTPGREARAILEGLVEGELKALILCGADPVADTPDGDLAERAIDTAELVVAVDLFLTASSSRADVVFPAQGFAEKEGTVTNLEGRVQKVNRLVAAPGQCRPDWAVFDDLADRMGAALGLASAELIAKEIAAVAPAYAGISWELLEWEHKEGVVVPYGDAAQPLEYLPVAAQLEAQSAPLVLHVARTLYDDGVLLRHSRSLHRLAPGAAAHLRPEDAAELGVAEGDTVRVTTSRGSAEMPVRLEESLARGTVYVPFNQPGAGSVGDGLEVQVTPVGGGES